MPSPECRDAIGRAGKKSFEAVMQNAKRELQNRLTSSIISHFAFPVLHFALFFCSPSRPFPRPPCLLLRFGGHMERGNGLSDAAVAFPAKSLLLHFQVE